MTEQAGLELISDPYVPDHLLFFRGQGKLWTMNFETNEMIVIDDFKPDLSYPPPRLVK